MPSPIPVALLEKSNGIGDCPGFKTAAVGCDVRGLGNKEQLDLAMVLADEPCPAAGVFTLNDLCAAPVRLCKEILSRSSNKVAGFVANSGNANAATGEQGMTDAKQMAAVAQLSSGVGQPFLICSTGRIGRKLPMNRIEEGIEKASKQLAADAQSSLDAADAILTSDTRRKVATARFQYQGKTVTVSGMAKGAGMIEPHMATMLAFLTTDVVANGDQLKNVLTAAVNQTFNRISIDGDMSTNDSVLLLASGKSGVDPWDGPADLLFAFKEAVFKVCDRLAELIVGDGEKVTKLVELIVEGCPRVRDAEKVARAIGNSLLVKASWYGSDPNWGRVADAAGYARVGLKEELLDIHYDEIPTLIKGIPREENKALWKEIVSRKRFRITVNLNLGDCSFRLLTSDLSEAYVDFNKSE
ncbi:MAG TPA: bifunctional glutamate N-acetyltransferase/amino-acid acetyltransferase ArgJ [Opitutales bacterium]|nr:bifunctional glutamate N-acetyltransferase/amino-acid acetyltransferase ArgJ [Opitutales bacterium]